MTIIDREKTGQQIRLMMKNRGITIKDVKRALSLGCVQSVYHWLDGQSIPTLENLYALSELLKVPMDMLVCGNRQYDTLMISPSDTERIYQYFRIIRDSRTA